MNPFVNLRTQSFVRWFELQKKSRKNREKNTVEIQKNKQHVWSAIGLPTKDTTSVTTQTSFGLYLYLEEI